MTPEALAVGVLAAAAETGAAPLRVGDVLVKHGATSADAIATALENQRRWGCRLGEALIAQGAVTSYELAKALGEHAGLFVVDLIAEPPDSNLSDANDIPLYLSKLLLPWRRIGDVPVIAITDPSPEMRQLVAERYGAAARLVITGKFDVLWRVQTIFRDHLGEGAMLALDRENPQMSARRLATTRQKFAAVAIGASIASALALAPQLAAALILITMSGVYAANIILRLLLFAAAWFGGAMRAVGAAELAALDEAALPTYSILVPLYREANMMRSIADALKALDYPAAKLDIKLVLEADDQETIAAAKALRLDSRFEIISVPPSPLRTKPKACNYALNFVRGDYTVIYDAEDRPDPDQLKKAIAAFRTSRADVACLQARLNVYNPEENWLTRMFALEYAAWFDFLLPGMALLGIPIPLGGTSNHFRTEILRAVSAWDAFNVTEDADLGLRLARLGYRVEPLDSSTYEEAVPTLTAWVRQRSRWMKGYMQTALVHARQPRAFIGAAGFGAYAGISIFVGGAVATALLAPLFWVVSAILAIHGSEFVLDGYGSAVTRISYFSLLGGTAILTLVAMLAPLKRRWIALIPYGATVCLYWLLISASAYRGLWQLLRSPTFWEKTPHGIARRQRQPSARSRLRRAAA